MYERQCISTRGKGASPSTYCRFDFLVPLHSVPPLLFCNRFFVPIPFGICTALMQGCSQRGFSDPRAARFVERTGGADALPVVSLDHTCRADRVTTSRRW